MLAALIRLEGTLANAGVPFGDAPAAVAALIAMGLPVVVGTDLHGNAARAALAPVVAPSDVVLATPGMLGAAPFSVAGLAAVADRLQLPPRRIYAVSADEMDIAAATLAMMPTLHVRGRPDAPRSVADLTAAVAELRGPYARAALELRAVFEGFHAKRRGAPLGAESDRASGR